MATTVTVGPTQAPAAPARPPDLPSDHDVRELRLALVCYGGVSLAIYMHGVTKELHRLVKGSALLDAGLAPDADSPSESVYGDLLRSLAKESGVSTRVVVDVVAGTSAGGINGIYLTKAIAHKIGRAHV